MKFEIAPADLDSLLVLIDCMRRTPRMPDNELRNRLAGFSQKIAARMLLENINWGEARGGTLSFTSGMANREKVLQKNDDFEWHLGVAAGSFSEFLESGEIPPPYYIWRLCVLLRRSGRADIEFQYLACWLKHFRDRGLGARYRELERRFNSIRGKKALKLPEGVVRLRIVAAIVSYLVATSAAFAVDCKSIVDGAARLACFDKSAVPRPAKKVSDLPKQQLAQSPNEKACILKASEYLPRIGDLRIEASRTRPGVVPANWPSPIAPIIVEVDFKAAGQQDTYSYLCAIGANGQALVQRLAKGAS